MESHLVPAIQDTAYPRIKSSPSIKDLDEIYTPTPEEQFLAQENTKTPETQLGFLILFKSFQRLGYAVPVTTVPSSIIKHISEICQLPVNRSELQRYDRSKSRTRHLTLIRDHLNIQSYGRQSKQVLVKTMKQAVETLQDLVDIINVSLEELIRNRYELPGFTTLERLARSIRKDHTQQLYQQISNPLSRRHQNQLDDLFHLKPSHDVTDWTKLKHEPGRPTLKELKALIERYHWLSNLDIDAPVFETIPDAKFKDLAAEARALDADKMKRLPPKKRYTLALAFLIAQRAQTLDDLTEMFIKQMKSLHNSASNTLQEYREAHEDRTDGLILTLKDFVIAFTAETDIATRWTTMTRTLKEYGDTIIEDCQTHLNHTSHNYLPFLRPSYNSYRATLFRLLEVLPLRSATQETQLIDAIAFIQSHRRSRKLLIATDGSDAINPEASLSHPCLDLSWIPKVWWPLVTEQSRRTPTPVKVHRHYLELCVFSHMLLELQSGDLYVEGSSAYQDYQAQLISWQEYEAQLSDYEQRMNIATDPATFIKTLREQLQRQIHTTDQGFPNNTYARFEKDKLVIKRSKRKHVPGAAALKLEIEKRINPVNLLDILSDTERWLHWSRCFKPLSGFAAKLTKPIARYIATIFCYGCGLGPSQLSRSLKGFDRKQLFRVNQGHVTPSKLQNAIDTVINSYNRFSLPKFWGTGKHASVDGTKWDMYEQNLLAEYHIRYGGYGGIGYYHVTDQYIAQFSQFIPCGVYEAVYMLDGLYHSSSNIQPDTIHGDTHSQSCTVFGLSYLLGIRLMPRIRRLKHLTFYRPSRTAQYEHIDRLFTDIVDWKLIEKYLPDMLRVVLSIQARKFAPSTILRKLGTKSHKNKLFQAFYSLGCVIRTIYLMEYIHDVDVRDIVQAATNKSETFNAFIKWISFGGDGVMATNNREEQRKRIGYNHLVANCLIFYNVSEISRILNELQQEGYEITSEVIGTLSPYIRKHINRLGQYVLNTRRKILKPNYNIFNFESLNST